jgi:hypothetical protein
MDAWMWIAIVAAVLFVVVVVAAVLRNRRTVGRSERLRGTFGSEYERVVQSDSTKDRRAGEAELERRQMRRAQLDIRPLAPQSRDLYAHEWAEVQRGFVDDPDRTVQAAESLVVQVMAARGYPVAADFENQAELVSVDHPHLVTNYRNAHGVFERSRRHEASTEELRSSFVHYRAVFEELLGEPTHAPANGATRPETHEVSRP